jgi:hypothetical protein
MFNFKKKTFVGRTGDLQPSPVDTRDYLLSSYIPSIKRYPEAYPPMFDLDILNQGSEPSCVGFSLAGIKQFNELKEKEYKKFDGSWIYKEAKKIDGIPDFPGTFLRSGLSVLKDTGAKAGEEDPSIYRIASYASVDDLSFEGLKKAICLYGVVLAGFRGSNQGWSSETIRAPRAGENVWGHAVFLTGYEKNHLIGQNSWGTQAHNQGLFKVPANYMPFEAWVILLDKTNEPRAEANTGWVAKTYLNNENKTIANLNVRTGAGTKYPVIVTLPKGTQVILFTPSEKKLVGNHWWVEIII